jgi:GNAT superfamily N-acetyltransferase
VSETARRARPDDVARLTELSCQAHEELSAQRGGALWSVREARAEPVRTGLAAAVDDPAALVVAGCYHGVVVGFASVHVEPLRDGSALAVLDEIYVEPEARGVAVGEAMMELVLTWCRERGLRGIDSLALPGTRETKNFFERFGLTARAIIVHRDLRAREAEQ